MGEGALRALKVAVVLMGVLIIGGTGLLGVLIARRMSGAAHPSASTSPTTAAGITASPPTNEVILDEPTGSRIAGTTLASDRIAIALQGGGPDRVVVLDLRSGRIIARARLRP